MSDKKGLFIRMVERTKLALISLTSAKDLDVMQSDITAKINATEKGAVNGVAPLNGSALIDGVYLPSYIDDVLDFANFAAFPPTGESGKIYVAIDTAKQYRWSGAVYIEVSAGETAISIGAIVNSATAKTTPSDTDMVGLMDSAAANIWKKLSWLNLKATLKTYFDSRYASITTTYIEVSTTPTGSQFSLPSLALASISGNTSTNRFVIRILPGTYIDTLIDLSTKPYVSVVGVSIQSVVLLPLTATQHMIKIGAFNEVSFLWIEGVGVGYAGVAAINCGDYAQLHKVTFTDCYKNILVEASSSDSIIYAEYCDFNGVYAYGVDYVSTNGFLAYCNFENGYNLPIGGTPICFHGNGSNAKLDVLAGGNKQLGTQSGTGIIVENGAFADVQAVYFKNFTTAISLPNVGAGPIALFSGVTTSDNGTAISVQHPSAQGSFQGSMGSATPPVISIVSGAMFGISYLDRLLGNKKTIEFDGLLFNLVSGITPTTTAATTAVLTATGTRFVVFGGGNADTAGCSVMFQIPSDYQRGGTFKVVYSSQTGTPANFKLNFILSKKAIGADFATTTETGLSSVNASTTQYQKRQTSVITPATAFVVGDNITIRIYRLGNDVADTFTSDVYIVNFLFEYESNK